MSRKQKADGTSDLEERLNNYIVTERNNAVNTSPRKKTWRLPCSIITSPNTTTCKRNSPKSYKRR